MSILHILELPQFDNTIESYEIHTYSPYSNSFGENDEIRTPIQQQDLYVLPSASSLHIEGYATAYGNDQKPIKDFEFSNNPFMFLF